MYQRQTIFLTTDFVENSHRHRIEIAATGAVACVFVRMYVL